MSVHSLGADIVALIAEDASTDVQPNRRSTDFLVSAPNPAAAAEDAKTIDPENRSSSSKAVEAKGGGAGVHPGRLATLKTIEPGGINAVAEDNE